MSSLDSQATRRQSLSEESHILVVLTYLHPRRLSTLRTAAQKTVDSARNQKNKGKVLNGINEWQFRCRKPTIADLENIKIAQLP